MEYCIYKHTSPSGKVYIGQTCQKPEHRWKNGNGYSNNQYFTRAIKKYGWDNFKHEILSEGLSKKEADILEVEIISKYNSSNHKYGYNIEHGGYGKGKHSPETLRKMSENHKGITAWNKGILMSKEQKLVLSKIRKGKPSSFKGKHHSNKAKQCIRESQIKNMKPVLCIETGIVYKSLQDAEDNTGINRKSISKVCNKITYNGKSSKTAGGYHWQFFNSDANLNR